jgi:hypothetical protein
MRSTTPGQDTNYYHWASKAVKLRRRRYPQSGHPKPNGLWFDVNEDWKRWCEATDFRLEDLGYRHTVTLLDPSRILFLRNAKDIDAFTRKYKRSYFGSIQLLQSSQQNEDFARQYGRDLFGEIQAQFSNTIEWDQIAEIYSGIIVSPYSRSRRDTYLWYYGWHCASGCIWDTSVLLLGSPCKMA